tara:strand:- start:1261 stop:1626 length:366 start_codon:yes stop_codon:yes gene_type:complete
MSGLFGGVDMPEGMSAADRKDLLDHENTLAAERDEKARQFQREQDRLRQAQEKEVRQATELQEAERIQALEEMERAAAGAAETETNIAQADKDRKLTQMWGALGTGQEANTFRSVEEQRPE